MAIRSVGEHEPHLVVVGSSAGGIDALSSLLGDLPAEFPAPIVLAQHIDPRRPSHLAPILARRSAMRVAPVEGRTMLEDGVVYVVPANRHVRIDDGYVDTVEPDSGGPRPSVDLLLETAARAYGETLIAVVLTGSGSDGAAGARAVRGAGGTVIVQNPSTAEFPGMPGSLAPSSVDVVAELEAIPALLVDLVSGGLGLERPEDERPLNLLLDQLRTQSGIDFTAYKRPTILRRLARRMAATGTRTVREYVRYLQRDPAEHARLVSSFLIKVTEFFRDPELYDHLRTTIIPALVADAAQSRELRIWSAGCATGEEAYSLAIVIAEVLGDELPTWTVRIFATDLDPDAITYARRGLYAASSVERLPRQIVERYFDRVDGSYLANRRIRALTVFGQHDLAQRAPFPRIDLTVCRNVLIYFTPELQKRALQLFAFSLRDGGYLVLGKAETTTPLAIPFVLEEQRLRVFRRRGPRTLMPAWSATPTPLVAGPAALPPVVPRGREAGARGSAGAAQAEALLQELPVGVVVVNREYDIQSINATARRLLQVHGTATGRDLIHLSRAAGIGGLRDLIDSALSGTPGTIRAQAQVSDGFADRAVDVRIEAHPTQVHADRAEGALLLVHDVMGDAVPRGSALPEAEPIGPERRAEQARRLVVSNRELLADNEALVVMASALRSQNDDLLIATEEAQAATEEVETLNEELQATNEELETLNEELQSTIEELNTSTEDALARTHALEEMRVSLELQQAIAESERTRLATVLSAMGDAVVVVDRHGAEVLRNRAYADLMERDELVPIDDSGQRLPPDEALLDRAARGESFTVQFRASGGNGARHWFEVAGEPIPGDEGRAAGGVLVIRDITVRSLAAMQEEFLAIVTHELRTPLTALSGYLQLLGSEQGTAAERRRYVDLASGQAHRLQELVGDLVDAVRVQTGHLSLTMTQVNLAELVRDTVGIVRPLSDGQEIDLQVDEEPWVLADAGRLQQVLLNVLTNAITHARASNRIELRVGEGAQAEVSVRDFGPGIPGERLAGLFSSARPLPPSSSGDGLGLGLYISTAIMAAHGGGLTAVSEVGKGTTVTISLPAVAAPVVSARA